MADTEAVIAAVLGERQRRLQQALLGMATDELAAQKRLRTTARRLRSDLRCFGSLLDPVTVEALTARAMAVADAIGPLRDLQLIASSLEIYGAGIGGGGVATLAAQLETEIDAARDSTAAMLASGAAELLNADLQAIASQPPLVQAGDAALPRAAAAVLLALVNALDSMPQSMSERSLHRLRIRTKRARYALEVMTMASPDPRWPVAPLRELQDRLGEIQDAAVAAEWLQHSATGVAAAAALRLAARARAHGVARRVGIAPLIAAARQAAEEGRARCASC